MRIFVVCSCLPIGSVLMLAATNPPRTPFLKAVEGGMVKLTMEGVADGDELVLTFANVGREAVSIQVQQGETEIPIRAAATPARAVLVISLPQARSIDLPAGKSRTITVSQVGGSRLLSGKIVFEKTQDGMRTSFENATTGAAKRSK
jgi:hypothetical protein